MTTSTVLFVGESPPAGSAPDFRPFDCASGTRLASILGLVDRAVLLAHVPLTNLFAVPTGVKGGVQDWSDSVASSQARAIAKNNPTAAIACLGKRIAEAFDMPVAFAGYRTPAPALLTTWRHEHGPLVIYAPHPSGSSVALNSAAVRTDVRQALLPEMVLGCPSLRPWHFRLDDPAVLADLAVAVAPRCPAVGAAALLWAREQHAARQARVAVPLLSAAAEALRGGCYSPTPAWDCYLKGIASALLMADGARWLATRWGEYAETLHRNADDRWLLKRAEVHAPISANASRAVVRATTLRYQIAGLA